MEALSARYGWTPKQIRDMEAHDVMQYLEIIRQMKASEKSQGFKNKR